MSPAVRSLPGFQVGFFEREKELMQRLAREGQSPAAMFIGCSDSRVVPEFLLDVKPGDLFVVRNMANVVPPSGVGETGTGATIEYAVRHLQVDHLVVCGHLDCGGLRHLDAGADMAAEPNLSRWLEWARPAQTQVDARGVADPDQRHQRIAQANVLLQLGHLQTYECVSQALKAGKLELHGWVFSIGTGELWVFDPARAAFELMQPAG